MRILGVDLGSSSIKLVEIDSAFGRFEIHDHHEIRVEPTSTPHATLAKWVQNTSRKPDRIITGLDGSRFTFRNLQLPTRDKKAIQASIGFELEDELPFAIDQSAYEFVVLAQAKGASQVHVAVTLRDQLKSAIEPWAKAGVEPDVITTEAWAYRTVLNQVLTPEEQEGPVLLVQLGHHRTTFYLHWRGVPALIRDFSWGGADLTLAISQKRQIPLDQAEEIQANQATIYIDDHPAEITPEQIELSEALKIAAEPMINELRHIQLTARNLTRKPLQKIFLAGGMSLLPGLDRWIQEQFRVPTQKLKSLSASSASGVTYSEQTDSKFLLAAAYALCLVGSGRNSCINYRKGEYAKVSIVQKIDFKTLKKPAMALGAMAASLVLSVSVQSFVFKSRLESTNAQLEKSIKSFFGQVSSSTLRGYLSDTQKLKKAVTAELNKQRELARLFGPNPRSPAAFLNQISIAIPKDTVVDLLQFQAGIPSTESFTKGDAPATSSLTFEVSNPQMGERLAALLGKKLNQMKRGEMEEVSSTSSDLKKWKITLSGTPSEDAYGK